MVVWKRNLFFFFLCFYFRHSLEWYRSGCVHTIADSFSLRQEKLSAINPLSGFYIGFILWGKRPATSVLGGLGACPPRKFFEMNMRWDAICCILRQDFEKCYSVCTADLVASGWFFRYSYLYTVMMTIFFFWGGGELGILGGKLLPLKYPR